ncbi:hypothetical protein [Streptomyces zaomyceticus]|uniref:hypothetical protein n=1 Tax=Streptomyces zaomyceticus TaxID=68286 RepID=UPI002E0F0060|nr:hypothetical protein OG237_42330 [Streptomyces zaomyceticus]
MSDHCWAKARAEADRVLQMIEDLEGEASDKARDIQSVLKLIAKAEAHLDAGDPHGFAADAVQAAHCDLAGTYAALARAGARAIDLKIEAAAAGYFGPDSSDQP